jgi:hypothetical protein
VLPAGGVQRVTIISDARRRAAVYGYADIVILYIFGVDKLDFRKIFIRFAYRIIRLQKDVSRLLRFSGKRERERGADTVSVRIDVHKDRGGMGRIEFFDYTLIHFSAYSFQFFQG